MYTNPYPHSASYAFSFEYSECSPLSFVKQGSITIEVIGGIDGDRITLRIRDEHTPKVYRDSLELSCARSRERVITGAANFLSLHLGDLRSAFAAFIHVLEEHRLFDMPLSL